MNEILEQKIKDLMDEADRQGTWTVHAVLHMLLGAHQTAQQRQFAQHCCQFSTARFQMETSVSDRVEDLMDGIALNSYHH